MIYLGTSMTAPVQEAMRTEEWLGLMNTPASGYSRAKLAGVPWAADNGSVSLGPDGPYSNPAWDVDAWFTWLDAQDRGALFACVPDVVGDWRATQQRWTEHSRTVRMDLGFKAAYVLQDGATGYPFEADAVFVGGSDAFKLSQPARDLVTQANAEGKWTHMGRVNSLRRIRIASDWGCDSVDGTFLAFGPDVNLPRLRRYMRRGTEPTLWSTPTG